MTAPTLDQILSAISQQVMHGKTALGIAQGLIAADRVVFNAAPVFFAFTSDANLELAQNYAARLYDSHAKAITVNTLLAESKRQRTTFKRGKPDDVLAAVAMSHALIASLKAPLEAIRKRRNEVLAHLDPATVINPQGLNTTAKLTIIDLVKVFSDTEKIVLTIDSLYSGVFGELRYLGEKDYTAVLDHIADSICAKAEEFEKLSGEPWTFPLPEKCADHKTFPVSGSKKGEKPITLIRVGQLQAAPTWCPRPWGKARYISPRFRLVVFRREIIALCPS
jgi:hypothetical protein